MSSCIATNSLVHNGRYIQKLLPLFNSPKILWFGRLYLVTKAEFFLDFSGRGIPGISIPNSTYSSSNGTEIILLKAQSSSKSIITIPAIPLSGRDGILFQFYLFSKNVAFHSLFLYSTSFYSQKLSKGMQSKVLLNLDQFYALIDQLWGPYGKIFGPQFWSTDRTKWGPYEKLRFKYFPYSVWTELIGQ